MTPKKFTRGFFYLLGAALTLTLLSAIVMVFAQNWAQLSVLALGILAALLLTGLFKLANWAFDETPQEKQKKLPANFTAPNYFREGDRILSDGRSCYAFYKGNKFLHNMPQSPYIGETVGDYRWGEINGDWMWIYEGDLEHVR